MLVTWAVIGIDARIRYASIVDDPEAAEPNLG
jgi:hypothetical protein